MAMTLLGKTRLRRGLAALVPALLLAAAFAGTTPFPADAQQPQKRGAQAAVPPPAIDPGAEGVWIDHTGRGAVEIVSCDVLVASATGAPPPPADPAVKPPLCGRIVWLQAPNDPQGRPLVDSLNKNAAKRGAPICGLQIIGEVKPQADGSWDKGWIYDPEQGSSFDVELRLRNPETLQVKGYLGVKFLSETFVWRRAKQAPPKCGA